nr:unnamed protein product [Spirometra erinaceieuropaei]
MGAHLVSLILQVASGDCHVGGSAITTQPALAFRKETLLQVAAQAVEKDAPEDLPYHMQRGNASKAAAELPITFPPKEAFHAAADLSFKYQLVAGDFNLPEVRWSPPSGPEAQLSTTKATSSISSKGLLLKLRRRCELGRANERYSGFSEPSSPSGQRSPPTSLPSYRTGGSAVLCGPPCTVQPHSRATTFVRCPCMSPHCPLSPAKQELLMTGATGPAPRRTTTALSTTDI